MLHFIPILAEGIGLTLAVTFGSFAVGSVVAVPLVLMRRSHSFFLRAISRALVDVVRGVPPLVWLFIIFFGVGTNPAFQIEPLPAAVIGFGVVSAAYLSEIYRGALLGVDDGQWEAGEAMGFSHFEVLRWVIFPQAVRIGIPAASTYLVGLLKDSAIASTIGVNDITFIASGEASRTLEGLSVFGAAAALYLLLSLPLAVISRTLYRRLSPAVKG